MATYIVITQDFENKNLYMVQNVLSNDVIFQTASYSAAQSVANSLNNI